MLSNQTKNACTTESTAIKHPSTVLVIGPSGAGKTKWVAEKLLFDPCAILPAPTHIIIYYASNQPYYQEIYKQVQKIRNISINFVKGIDDFSVDNFNPSDNTLIIFDDLFRTTKDSEEVAKLWFVGSHHKSITAVLISHNIFPKGKVARDLALNTHYLVIFSQPADLQSFKTLAQRLEPLSWRLLVQVYKEEISMQPHAFLIIDLKPSTPAFLKYRTSIGSSPGHSFLLPQNDS